MSNLLKNISDWAASFGPKPLDLQKFNDPIAEKVAWTPLKSGGASFKTHRGNKKTETLLEFEKTIVFQLFWIFFISFIILVSVILSNSSVFDSVEQYGVRYLIYIPVFAIIAFCIKEYKKGIYFDKQYNYFWKGSKDPSNFELSSNKNAIKLDEIHAIQIIRERVSSSKSSYNSFELNLVLKNAERMNVIDHGKLKSVRKDAYLLAEFLNVKVWDGV